MKFSLDNPLEGNLIRSYGPGQVSVGARVLTESAVVTADAAPSGWPPTRFEELAREHFAALVELSPEVVVLGCGARLRFPSPELTAPLVQAGIGLEVMDTGAACRTYNVLAAEGRRVAAALLMIEES
jgi:uncharacterized protein